MNADLELFPSKTHGPLRGIAALLLAGCLAVATGCDQAPSDDSAVADETDSTDAGPADPKERTAEGVLRQMIAAYQEAEHYSDEGVLNVTVNDDLQTVPFHVTFSRPNKINLFGYQVEMVSDGSKLHCRIHDETTNNLDSQVLQADVPEKLTLGDLLADVTVRNLLQGQLGPPPALSLLFEEQPFAEVLNDADQLKLLSEEKIGEDDCFRVQYTQQRGKQVFWIDTDSYLLRRLEFPTAAIIKDLEVAGAIAKKISLVAEISSAKFAVLKEPSFAYKAADEDVLVRQFVEPLADRMPPMIGKAVSGLSFTDAEGKKITDKTLSGKVVILDFWFTTCPPCRQSMPNLQKVYEQFKDNDKVAFFAVNVDEPTITDDDLKKAFVDWGAAVPIARDPEYAAAQALQVEAFPSLVLLGKDGMVQSYEIGFNPRLAETLPAKLHALLAGSNLAAREIRKIKEEFEQELAAAHPDAKPQQPDRVEPAAADKPEKLGMTKLWTSGAATQPENILVVPGDADKDDHVYVLDQYRTVVALGADGKPIATHPLDIAEADLVTYLRTATDGDEKRYFVGGGAGQTRFHLFDEQWKRRFSLPEEDDAAQVISDLVLADLDGDKNLEVYVSHWQDLALYRFSLDGKRNAWRGEAVRDVLSLALSPANAEGKRLLLALGRSGKIRGVGAEGKVDAESDAPDPTVQKLVVAERDIDRDVFWSALSMAPGRGAVVAMKGDSQLAWRFTVPGGFPQTAIEPVVWGHVLPGGKAHWVVAGADGGIHIVAADGSLVDRFHHGEMPTGIALAKLGGKPTLLVSSVSGVTAYRLTEK